MSLSLRQQCLILTLKNYLPSRIINIRIFNISIQKVCQYVFYTHPIFLFCEVLMPLNQLVAELPWGLKKRLEFIEFKLFWEGKVNRGDLNTAFNISTPQASADLGKYQELVPDNLSYDRSGKFYYPTENFKPLLIQISSDYYLGQLQAISMGLVDQNSTGISNVPTIGHTPIPPRQIDPHVLKAVKNAIIYNQKLEVYYQSMSKSEPSKRWISPHALAFDEFRWHVRAFCHNDLIYKDFVLGRIISIGGNEPSNISSENDNDWNRFFTLIIAPNPKLNESQKKVIELDYGMIDGKLEILTRISLLKYLLKTYGLDKDTDLVPANEQHIVIFNRNEALSVLNNKLTF